MHEEPDTGDDGEKIEPTAPDETFVALIERVREGDESAMAELVQEYEQRLRLTARMLLGPALRSYLDSVDLTQSVHRTLLLGLRNEKFSVSNPDQLMALLLGIVKRKVGRQWRRVQRERRLRSSGPSSTDSVQILASFASSESTPAETAQLNDAIEQLLRKLSEVDRRLIELRLEGYSTVQVAAELGLDAHTLRARLSRLRQRLHKSGLFADWL